uniref:Uncharacterized protein n=1 Tax=Strigamia maritima TaxID=126957 RepID=T1IHM3_STRMM
MGATAVIDTETEKDKDAQAIFEKAQLINKETKRKDDDKVYRGLNNYTQFYEKRGIHCMHDRTDYKHGWQLEKEIQEYTYGQEDASRYETP